MNILFVSSEVEPFSKTGGLADVSAALPKALERLGHKIYIITPKYKAVDEKKFDLVATGQHIEVPVSNKKASGEILQASLGNNISVYFIKKDEYYFRDYLYSTPEGDYLDNAERFAFFSRGAIEAAKALDISPDIIHCNDWQTGLIPLFLKTHYKDDQYFDKTKTILTIHNLGYQGQFWALDIHLLNLGMEYFTPQTLEFYGKISFLKAGIVFSDAVTTVSKKYREEIQTPEYGCGFEGLLKERAEKIYGIINGIDYDEWDPAKDNLIVKNYSIKDIKGKKDCKADLQKAFNLPLSPETPLIGMISRLSSQKGWDIFEEAVDDLIKLDIQFTILGTGDEKYHHLVKNLAKKYPDKISAMITFDNTLSHKIEAGADMLLMPSKYEPCGLNQMISLRYGTVPIVHATGGLDDVIRDYDLKKEKGNGFKFTEYTPTELIKCIKRAIKLYKSRARWDKLIIIGMKEDHSWEKSAEEYDGLYKKVLK
ncbi:MAG: glycogen synthase GlgA [Nitrospirota bacterium]|jgi:starch synthase